MTHVCVERVEPSNRPGLVEVVRALDRAAAARQGHPALGDDVWRDLAQAGSRSSGWLARVDHVPVGYLHVGPARILSLVAAPGPTPNALLAAEVAAEGADHELELWWFGAGDDADVTAAEHGFTMARELWQMRVRLPLRLDAPLPPDTRLEPFVPGRDDDDWLDVNNRAFAHDPDQGGWTLATLHGRVTEPWFDPADFLVAHDADGIAGFCWTKVHRADPPLEPDALGEIYVIGADPSRQGRGLGRALVAAGLVHLHDARDTPVGMLFVDAANGPAVGLYRALGFSVARVDRCYRRPPS